MAIDGALIAILDNVERKHTAISSSDFGIMDPQILGLARLADETFDCCDYSIVVSHPDTLGYLAVAHG